MAVIHEGPIPFTTPQLKAATGREALGRARRPAIRKFIVTKPLGAAGGAIILLMVRHRHLCRCPRPLRSAMRSISACSSPPRACSHWFGTDEFGRDLFTRIVYGARVALFIGLTAAFVGATCGAILGVVSAYLGGRVDLYLQRVIDVLLAFRCSSSRWRSSPCWAVRFPTW